MALFEKRRWPNNMEFRAIGGIGCTEGLRFFSDAEITRRQDLVRSKLKEVGCDILMVQGHFMPTVMGIHTKIAWLTGSNGYRSCATLILPNNGELAVIHGRKPSSNPGWITPYTQGEDLTPHLAGVKRIAYADTAYLGYQFHEYLRAKLPDVEIVDFTNEIEHMMAVKSAEEIAAIEDACEIQKRCWQAASAFVRPGRLITEIRADFHYMMLNLGMDPTLMPKIILFVGKNRPEGLDPRTLIKERDYALQADDYIVLNFETPGSGGYYAERCRYFFFSEPHPALKTMWGEVLRLHEYQMSLYRPGTTMRELRERINSFKLRRGFLPEGDIGSASPLDDATPEIRGIGILTVDRPQIQLEWEDVALQPGIVFTSMPTLRKDSGEYMKFYEMMVMTDTGPSIPAPHPIELFVL